MLSETLAWPGACVFFRAVLASAYDCRNSILQQGLLRIPSSFVFIYSYIQLYSPYSIYAVQHRYLKIEGLKMHFSLFGLAWYFSR